jgi:TolB-like protein
MSEFTLTPTPEKRRLAAVVFTDVVGYSARMQRDETDTIAKVEADFDRMRAMCAQHGGEVLNSMGDGLLLCFQSAAQAVSFALEVQDEFWKRKSELPAGQSLEHRMGVHLGDVVFLENGTIAGDGVNIAARLEGKAPHGGICISQIVYDTVKRKVPMKGTFIGPEKFKNIAEPIPVWHIRSMGMAEWTVGDNDSASKGDGTIAPDPAPKPKVPEIALKPGGTATAAAIPGMPEPVTDRPSIAILPFDNLGNDPDQGYFSDGVTEDIITELSRWRFLAVRSRSASFRYRGPAADLQQVARELSVRFIVEGSIRRMGSRIRITAQLIDSETGSHVWAERFDRDAADIFSVQDKVVQTIVSSLAGRIQVADADRARRKPPASLAAYECVLKGNALSWDDPKSMAEAKGLFEKAIGIDPCYGFAHALLAQLCCGIWQDDSSDSEAALQEAYTNAKRAVELDENDSACLSAMSSVHYLRGSFDLSLQYLRRATEINPNNQWCTADMGCLLNCVGRADEALNWFGRAKETDPYFDPPWFWRGYGRAYMLLHRYQEALAMFENTSTRNDRHVALMAGCHAQLGEMEQAKALAAECLAMNPKFSIGRYMVKAPFKSPVDAADLVACLKKAGLPD